MNKLLISMATVAIMLTGCSASIGTPPTTSTTYTTPAPVVPVASQTTVTHSSY